MVEEQKALAKIIGNDFELEEGLSELAIREVMIKAFNYLLDHDISRMMNILYRADVDEDQLKSLLINRSELPSAEVIADAYLNRQKEKIETWKKYSL